jgi:hypothetical protein
VPTAALPVVPAATRDAPPVPRDAGGISPVRTAPVRTVPHAPPRPVARSRAAPIGCGLAAFGLAGVGLVVAAVVAWISLGGPRVLTGTEASPEDAKDWRLVAGALGERGAAAELACGAARLQVQIVVEENGALRSAKLLNNADEAVRACVEAELKKAPFPRNGKGAVQVAVTLQQ